MSMANKNSIEFCYFSTDLKAGAELVTKITNSRSLYDYERYVVKSKPCLMVLRSCDNSV